MHCICADASPIALARIWRLLLKMIPPTEISCFRSAKKALESARKRGCDILFTDIDFGSTKGEGIFLAEEIKALYPRANIIFTTAAAEGEYTSRILKIRYSGFLNKPYTAQELQAELDNLRYNAEQSEDFDYPE